MALRAILQTEYKVLEADSAEQAMQVLQRERADLVTLDMLMPGEGGLETLRHIRESGAHTDVPVIMITGHASLDSACEALRLGATDYLKKPFGVDELKRSVRNGLRRHKTGPLPGVRGKNRTETAELPEHTPEETALLYQDNLMNLGKASAAFVHDVASPLQVLTILNSLTLQRLSEPATAYRDEDLRQVAAQMERLLSWAVELIKGWQSIAIPTTMHKEPLDVGPLLEHVAEVVRPFATLNSVEVSCQPLPHAITAYGDRTQIERALVNLCLNGIKASTSRGRTVEMSARVFQENVVFRFTDSGLGFTPERMKEVLSEDPFHTVSKKRRGLGLFIADWIAVNHDGKLQFICENGLGTTVEFFLPVKA